MPIKFTWHLLPNWGIEANVLALSGCWLPQDLRLSCSSDPTDLAPRSVSPMHTGLVEDALIRTISRLDQVSMRAVRNNHGQKG